MLKEGKIKKRQRREVSIEQLLGMAFPDVDVAEVDPNVLKSQLFDADTLRLDLKNRTITHTDEFKKEFADRFDGRDSECVVRRAARGMWEHVKRHGIPLQRGAARSSEYSLLYSVMLSYMAWIFPCPEEIERRMAKEGFMGAEARLVWLTGVRRTGQRILTSTEDQDEDALRQLAAEEKLDRKSADEVMEAGLVVDSLRAEVALPSPEIAEAMAKSVVRSGQVVVSSGGIVVRRRAGAKQLRRPKPTQEPTESEEERDDTSWFAQVVGPDVMGESHEEEDGAQLPEERPLEPNMRRARYMTLGAFMAGSEYVANAEMALPSAIRMMAAMTLRF
jgi:hypothetical protein